MKREKNWLGRFSRAARWMLPRKEAEEVIADYTDLLAEDTRTQEELERDLGDPVQAVRLLVQPGQGQLRQAVFGGVTAGKLWVVVFCALAACLLSAAFAPTPLSPSYMLMKWYEWSTNDPLTWHLYLIPVGQVLAGTLLSLAVFRRREGEEKKPLPKWIFLWLLLLLAGMGLAWFVVWNVSATPEHFLTKWVELPPPPQDQGGGTAWKGTTSLVLVVMAGWLEWGCCALPGVAGMIGLVRARMRDRRWSGVYVLALTLAVLALAVIAMLYQFSGIRPGDYYNDLTDGWFRRYILRFALITVTGLVGAGVSLC